MMEEKNNTTKNQFVLFYKLVVYPYSVLDMAQKRVGRLRNSYFQDGPKLFPFEAGIYEKISKEELEGGCVAQNIKNAELHEKRMDKSIGKFGIFNFEKDSFKRGVMGFYSDDDFLEIRREQERIGYDDDKLYKLVVFERHEGPEEKAGMPPGILLNVEKRFGVNFSDGSSFEIEINSKNGEND